MDEVTLQRQPGESEADFYDRCEDAAGRGPIDQAAFHEAATPVVRAILDEATATASQILEDVVGPPVLGESKKIGDNATDQYISASTKRGREVTVRLLLNVLALRGTTPTREGLRYDLSLALQVRQVREYCGDLAYFKDTITGLPHRVDPDALRQRIRRAVGLSE